MKKVPQQDGTREKTRQIQNSKRSSAGRSGHKTKKGTAQLHSAEEDRFSEAPEGERKARLHGDRRDHPQSSRAFVR
ncbi:hypothetical protein NPIL_250831, partial [Nephila pilipes]